MFKAVTWLTRLDNILTLHNAPVPLLFRGAPGLGDQGLLSAVAPDRATA